MVYPHWYSRFFSGGEVISQQKVSQLATQQVQQQNPQYAGNPMIVNMFEPQVGQQLVQQQILLDEAEKLGIHVTERRCAQVSATGPPGQVLFPNGKFIGQDSMPRLFRAGSTSRLPTLKTA